MFDIIDMQPHHLSNASRIWSAGWTQGHAAVVPAELVALRTPESFTLRMEKMVSDIRVVVIDNAVVGFHIVKGDELYQMYVDASAQGTGVAQGLIADAEARIGAAGHRVAWLDCAIGNDRAARFYEKSGWVNTGTKTTALDTLAEPFELELWRFEKKLSSKA